MTAGAGRAERVRFTAAERWTITVVVPASALMAIDITIVTVALPQIGDDLPGASLEGLQWVVVGYTFAFGALIQPAGSLSNRIGARRMFRAGMTAFTLASLACTLAPTMTALIVFRIFKGAAAAVMFANAMPVLAKTFTGARRAMAIAVWSAVVGTAGVAAPVLGGLLIDLGGWRWMFGINLPLGVLAVVIPARVLPADAPPATGRRRFDWPGNVLLVAALVALNYGLTLAQERGLGDASVLALLGSAVILGAGFALWQTRAREALLDLRLLADRSFAGVTLLALLNRIGTAGATEYFVLYLQDGHGLTPTQTGLLLLPLGVASLAGAIWAGKLQARISPKYVLAAGFALLAAAALVVAWQSEQAHNPWTLIPAITVWGLGSNALANTPLMNVATSVAPIQKVGMATGLLNQLLPDRRRPRHPLARPGLHHPPHGRRQHRNSHHGRHRRPRLPARRRRMPPRDADRPVRHHPYGRHRQVRRGTGMTGVVLAEAVVTVVPVVAAPDTAQGSTGRGRDPSQGAQVSINASHHRPVPQWSRPCA